DKYIGDAVMALFPNTADDAVKAGIAIQRCVLQYNLESRPKNQPAIAIGIGIHTGNLMLGTIGEEQRMESTVISDAVNLASRLEGLTKTYGADLIISDRTLESLENPEQYHTRFLGSVMVKGKRQPVSIFEVYDADSESLRVFKTATKAEFEKAVNLFQEQKMREAGEVFSELQQQNNGDRVLQLYQARCYAKV
ncbi:MAG: adenylate/guanylate cyclase domain-containing protein, partial [Jaaginema sp. PMC 1079.18]|nr:adenylate/guanylate cyclase domain-containing protein [Jaaginema sp. PMC 1079.18]